MAMRRSVTISAVGHVAVLAWALVSLPSDRPMSSESAAVDLVTNDEFTKLTAGTKEAPPKEMATPVAEKVGEIKPPDDPNAKVVENKKEIAAATDEAAPLPEAKPPEPKPPEPKPEPKSDPIAEAIQKAEPKKPEPPKPPPPKPQPKKEVKQQPKFDPRKVAALLDKRDPQREAASAPVLNKTASLGSTSTAHRLSQLSFDALRGRLMSLWNPPAGASNIDDLYVVVRVKLTPDGNLAGAPQVLNSSS